MTPLWLALPLVVSGATPTERALVELGDPAVLPSIGARALGPIAGGIAVVTLPADRRAALAALPGVRATTCPPGALRPCGAVLHPQLDRSLPAARIPALRERLATAGDGAVVGIVDTGVDPTHPDLVTDAGRARVAYIADLGEAPRGVFPELEALVDAAVYGPDEIQAAVDAGDPTRVGGADHIGHGTHVASIAAGARGVAPDAALVVVKASREEEGTFEDADVVLATRFVFAVAATMGRPAVVNLSLGGDDGAHDGDSLLERALVASLDEEPAGRFLVAAAGNGAYRDAHAVATLGPDEPTARIALLAPRPASGAPAYLRIAAFGSRDLQVALEPPDGADLSHATVAARADAGTDVVLDPATPGTWTLVLSGAGRADLWIAETDLVGPLGTSPRFGDHVDPGGQVTLPATAEAILAVGALATRTEWHDVDGATHRTPTLEEGATSVFSARGPTRDGRLKPDLVAPGEAIVAALSSETDPEDDASAFHHPGARRGTVVDEGHAVLWGTSAASAHVAGVVALLFADDPTLEAARVRSVLCGTATPRDARAWSVAHGWGALDAGATGAALEGAPTGEVDPDASLVAAAPDVVAPGESVRIVGRLLTTEGRAVREPLPEVRVRRQGKGPALPVTDLGEGRFEARWTAPPEALGREVVFEVQLDGATVPPVATVEVAWRRDDVGLADRVAGGGCSAGASRPQTGPALLPLALALCLSRKRMN